MITIKTVIRNSDKSIYSLGDIATSDNGIYRGTIDGFQQFEDDFRVHIISDDKSDREYFSITELDKNETKNN